jgi:hypothetical protein
LRYRHGDAIGCQSVTHAASNTREGFDSSGYPHPINQWLVWNPRDCQESYMSIDEFASEVPVPRGRVVQDWSQGDCVIK